MTKDNLIRALWNIIDDIDTYSDLCKDDNHMYRLLVEKRQKDRWNLPVKCDGYKIEILIKDET